MSSTLNCILNPILASKPIQNHKEKSKENIWEFFGHFLAYFWAPWGALGPPRGPKMGPGTPGIDLKSPKKISKIWAGSVNYF